MPQTKIINIGEMDTVRAPDTLKTTVGSCIALVLFDKRQKLFGMAHIMLPSADNTIADSPGRYADTAIMQLLVKMRVPPAGAHRLQAKLAGGANMFAKEVKSDEFKIGAKNQQAVTDILEKLKVPVLGADCGGNQAREVWIETHDVKVYVKSVADGQTREL